MTPYYSRTYRTLFTSSTTTLYHGTAEEVLGALTLASVTACVTDPPYGLAFMGKAWDGTTPPPADWHAIRGALRPGAPLLAFGGTRTWHHLATALEAAGFALRDTLMWLYGSGFPKSHDVSKAIDKAAGARREVVGKSIYYPRRANKNGTATYSDFHNDTRDLTAPATDAARLWHGFGTALKPAWEPVLLAMAPMPGTFADNAQRYGVAGLNVEAGRIACAPGDIGDRIDNPERPARRPVNHMNDDRSFSKARAYREPSGRWPANVLLDEAAAALLDEAAGERPVGPGSMNGSHGSQNTYDARWPKRSGIGYGATGVASRFFYVAKASPSERGEYNDHCTVKPQSLMRYLLGLVTYPERNLILDPFAGSGSTLLAAQALGLDCIGIDQDAHALDIAARRLEEAP